MSARELGINRNRLPECRGRRLQLFFLYERDSQVVGSFEIGGVQLQSPLQGGDGGIHLAGVGLRHAGIKKAKRIVRTELSRFSQFAPPFGKYLEVRKIGA